MSNNLFVNLNDMFDKHSGAMSGNIDLAGDDIPERRHYDIRAFHNDDVTVPRSMRDFDYWNVTSFDGTQMSVLDAPRIVSGRSVAARQIGTIDGLPLSELNEMEMGDLDLDTIVAGNEGWVGTGVTVGKDSAERWGNSIRIDLVDGVDKTVSSSFRDNLLADFDGPQDYFIELALPGFPAQAAGTKLDLNNSWIDFTSDDAYDPAATDSFRFSDSLNSLNAGGDTYWRINRNSLVNVTLTSIVGIRFRLRATGGNFTFKAMAMRLLPQDYTFDMVDVDTKRGKLARSVPRDAGTELTWPVIHGTSGDYGRVFYPSRPRNVKILARFNSGHIPASPNDNWLHLIGRHDTVQNDRIAVLMNSDTTETRLELRETVLGSGTILDSEVVGPLEEETDYFLVLDIRENKTSASIIESSGAFLGDVFMTTGWHTTTLVDRGYVGYRFAPYYYDFSVDYITVENAEFARYESAPFVSIRPVKAVTISSNESMAIDLAEGRYIPAGDAVVTDDHLFALSSPSKKFVRDGTEWQGGYITDDFLYLGNSRNLRVSGSLFAQLGTGQTALRGEYRVVLLDKNDSVAYIGKIRNLLPSQWNEFSLHVNTDFAPGNYKIIIQQTGFYADTFWIDNLRVEHQTLAWEVSPDLGVTWFPAMFAKDKLYSAVNFIHDASTNIKIRATALSENAWSADYQIIPHYGYPGRRT